MPNRIVHRTANRIPSRMASRTSNRAPNRALDQKGSTSAIPYPIRTLRKRIDRLDRELLKILALRMKAVEKIASFKKLAGMPILQTSRWNEIMEDRLNMAHREFGLDVAFTRRLLLLIHGESLRRENLQVRKKLS